MTTWLVLLVLVLCAVAGLWTVVMIARDESPPSDRYFLLLGALLLVLLVQLVLGIVLLADEGRVVEPVTFGAYLATVVLVVPFGAALALVERSRWGSAALLVALLTVAAMEARLWALAEPVRLLRG